MTDRPPLPGPCDIPKCPTCGKAPKGAAGVPSRHICFCDAGQQLEEIARRAESKRQPYTIWACPAAFKKSGFPSLGSFGSTVRNVVIMDAETFKRLVREHPSLATAEFRVGTEE